MPKLFTRIIAVLMVHCLMADSGFAISAPPAMHRTSQNLYADQALSLHLTFERLPERFLAIRRRILQHVRLSYQLTAFLSAGMIPFVGAPGSRDDKKGPLRPPARLLQEGRIYPEKPAAALATRTAPPDMPMGAEHGGSEILGTTELSGPVVERIIPWVDLAALIVGSMFGLPMDLVQKVRDKVIVRVLASSAQSSAREGVIYLCLSSSIDDTEKMWRALKRIASEVGHILVEDRPGSPVQIAAGVEEVFDAAARIALVTAVDFDLVRGVLGRLNGGFGRDILAALKTLKKTPEQFAGGTGALSRQVLRKIGVASHMSSWRLGAIAGDFFEVLPDEPHPLPYGAHHWIAGWIIGNFVRTLCDGNPALAVRIVGQTLLGNPYHLKSVGHFSARLRYLSRHFPRQHRPENIPTVESAVATVRQEIQSIGLNPLIISQSGIRYPMDQKWLRRRELTQNLVRDVLSEHFSGRGRNKVTASAHDPIGRLLFNPVKAAGAPRRSSLAAPEDALSQIPPLNMPPAPVAIGESYGGANQLMDAVQEGDQAEIMRLGTEILPAMETNLYVRKVILDIFEEGLKPGSEVIKFVQYIFELSIEKMMSDHENIIVYEQGRYYQRALKEAERALLQTLFTKWLEDARTLSGMSLREFLIQAASMGIGVAGLEGSFELIELLADITRMHAEYNRAILTHQPGTEGKPLAVGTPQNRWDAAAERMQAQRKTDTIHAQLKLLLSIVEAVDCSRIGIWGDLVLENSVPLWVKEFVNRDERVGISARDLESLVGHLRMVDSTLLRSLTAILRLMIDQYISEGGISVDELLTELRLNRVAWAREFIELCMHSVRLTRGRLFVFPSPTARAA